MTEFESPQQLISQLEKWREIYRNPLEGDIKVDPRAFEEAISFAKALSPEMMVDLSVGLAEDGEVNFWWDNDHFEIDLGFYGSRLQSYYAKNKRSGQKLRGSGFDPTYVPEEIQDLFTPTMYWRMDYTKHGVFVTECPALKIVLQSDTLAEVAEMASDTIEYLSRDMPDMEVSKRVVIDIRQPGTMTLQDWWAALRGYAEQAGLFTAPMYYQIPTTTILRDHRIIKTIPVEVSEVEGTWYARFLSANIAMNGENPLDAYTSLVHEIQDTYDDLAREIREMGKLSAAVQPTWDALVEHIEAKSDDKEELGDGHSDA